MCSPLGSKFFADQWPSNVRPRVEVESDLELEMAGESARNTESAIRRRPIPRHVAQLVGTRATRFQTPMQTLPSAGGKPLLISSSVPSAWNCSSTSSKTGPLASPSRKVVCHIPTMTPRSLRLPSRVVRKTEVGGDAGTVSSIRPAATSAGGGPPSVARNSGLDTRVRAPRLRSAAKMAMAADGGKSRGAGRFARSWRKLLLCFKGEEVGRSDGPSSACTRRGKGTS